MYIPLDWLYVHSTKEFVGCIDHVKKAIVILVSTVNFLHRRRHARHILVIHHKIDHLTRLKRKSISKKMRVDINQENDEIVFVYVLPDDGNELAHRQLLWNEKLGFIEQRKGLFFRISLDDHLLKGEKTAAPFVVRRKTAWLLLTGTLFGNLIRIPETSSFRLPEGKRTTQKW